MWSIGSLFARVFRKQSFLLEVTFWNKKDQKRHAKLVAHKNYRGIEPGPIKACQIWATLDPGCWLLVFVLSPSLAAEILSGVAEAASAPPPAEVQLLYPAAVLRRTPYHPPDSCGNKTHLDAHAVNRRSDKGREPSLRALRWAEGRAQAAQDSRAGEPRRLSSFNTPFFLCFECSSSPRFSCSI
jgi:hypothetical protein